MGGCMVIESIEVGRLLGHSGRCNRVSQARFRKLKGHIGRTGNYEPVVVRRHGARDGYYEILNGHVRVEVLKKLGYETCNCVVWEVDDDEALVLLGTLNRLGGKDSLDERCGLVRRLCERFDVKELARLLPETAGGIERLKDYSRARPAKKEGAKAFLNPVVFFVGDEEKRVIEEALKRAVAGEGEGTMSQKRSRGLLRIADRFME